MNRYLIVVDMQNDFIDGALGTKEAQAIVAPAREKIKAFTGTVVFTRDTHQGDYLNTQEGERLPVPHCIKGSTGWEIRPEIAKGYTGAPVFDKPTFGSRELAEWLKEENDKNPIDSIELIGLCTDICVVSNALLIKAFLPEVTVAVDAFCCAGTTPQAHNAAVQTMKSCQIEVG